MELKTTLEDIVSLLEEVFPQIGDGYAFEDLQPGAATVCLTPGTVHLRPGGTVSGPALFGLADLAFYVATLGVIGLEPMAVTTHLSIDFLRKPGTGRLTARAEIRKLGRRLSVGQVLIHSEGTAEPVVQATVSYALPPSSR